MRSGLRSRHRKDINQIMAFSRRLHGPDSIVYSDEYILVNFFIVQLLSNFYIEQNGRLQTTTEEENITSPQ
jgi:hypothetical protein